MSATEPQLIGVGTEGHNQNAAVVEKCKMTVGLVHTVGYFT
jgi:hypothetical protein